MRAYDRLINVDKWWNGEIMSWTKCLSLGKVALGKEGTVIECSGKRYTGPQGNPRRLLGEQKKKDQLLEGR